MNNHLVYKCFVLAHNRRLCSRKSVTLSDFYASIKTIENNIDIIKRHLLSSASVDRTYIRKLPQLLAKEFGYTVFAIIDGTRMEGVSDSVIDEINSKYRQRLFKLATEEELYQQLKSPKKYPNAINELLELFESALEVCNEVYIVLLSNCEDMISNLFEYNPEDKYDVA